jgi:hypothetical protein
MNRWKPFLLLLVTILAVGCSGIPRRDRDQEQLDRYLRYAKAPVDHITLLNHYDNWQSVSKYQVVLFANVNDAWLITVSPPCENLQFAQRIGITQTASTIYTRFDAILVKHWRCQITEIRPIDYLQMRRDQRAEKARPDAASK